METNLMIYVQNDRDVYTLIEWLQNTLAKKIRKGITPDTEFLKNSSTVKKIICMSKNLLFKYDHQVATKSDILEAKELIVNEIIETAYYIAGENKR